MKSYYSHGKLLLTGEYLVLDGANALAVPTKLGQGLSIDKGTKGKLHWTSFDHNHELWYKAEFSIANNMILMLSNNDGDITKRLVQILEAAKTLNPDFLSADIGFKVKTLTEFPRDWGLGTSSTLINNIALWAHIDAYRLLEATFGGSGYDIACASAEKSLTYQLRSGHTPFVNAVDFNPAFKANLYFVYLNQKQNSREGIAQYKANTKDLSKDISRITQITSDMVSCNTLSAFQELIDEHELLISNIIKQVPVKERLFSDFKGSIKSLGAWGGDFVMVATDNDPSSYFQTKGFDTIISYSDMVRI